MTSPAPGSSSTLERTAFVLLAAALGTIQFSIFVGGSILIPLAALLWLILTIRERRWPVVPAFFWPLVGLAGWTLLSSAFSSDPAASFERSRQLGLYLIVPMTVRLAAGRRAWTVTNVIIAMGAVAALIGIVQYAALGYDHLNHRPHGLLGHYMTYSGLLMLVVCAAVARLVYVRREWVWPAIAVPALLVALEVTESRNAWIGAALAVGVLLMLRNRKLLIALPVIAVLGFLVSPAVVKHRVLSIVDRSDPTVQDRFAMLEAGVHIVRDHPWFGLGPNMVPRLYLQYRTADAVDPAGLPPQTRSHLHNVPMQLAAERGVPAALLWLLFVIVALRDLSRRVRHGTAPALAAAGLAAVVAMVAAGMFEHNFGDSEFLILFLGLISLPFAADGAETTPEAAEPLVPDSALEAEPS